MMTSDRERSRVRRGHAWAREAQDLAPRHAHHSLSLLFFSPPSSLFFPLPANFSFSLASPLSPPFAAPHLSPSSPSPFSIHSLRFRRPLHRNFARLAGVMPCKTLAHGNSALIAPRYKWRTRRCSFRIFLLSSFLLFFSLFFSSIEIYSSIRDPLLHGTTDERFLGVIRFLVWYLRGDWNISIGYGFVTDRIFDSRRSLQRKISIRHDGEFLTKGWARGGGLKIEEDSIELCLCLK